VTMRGLLLALLLVTACGGSRSGPQNPEMTVGEAGASTVVIVVRNNLIPVETVPVFVQQLGGRPRLLGTLRANSTGTYTVASRDVVRGFTIRVERRTGVLQSRRINETAGWKHTWNVGSNIVLSERLPGTF
jgi:hypothetical protein